MPSSFSSRVARLIPLLLALGLTATATACTTASNKPAANPGTSATPAATPDLVAKAASEKSLVIYANVPADYFKPVIAAFNKAYPSITVQEYDLADNIVFSKYEAEHAQGARTADLLVSSAPSSWVQAEQNGVTANVTPAGLQNFPAFTNQGHGVYVMSAEPIITVYNAKLLTGTQIPTSYAQLAADTTASPSKYKLVSYPITNPFNYAAIYGLIHILGADKVWSYYDAIASHTTTNEEGLDSLTSVAQGGASISYVTSGLVQGNLAKYKALAGFSFMQDATPLIPRAIAVSAGAASPASAQLFLDFLYTKAGQDTLCQGGFEATMNDYTPPSGCTAALSSLATRVPANTTYLVPISQAVLDQQAAIAKRWNQAFHR